MSDKFYHDFPEFDIVGGPGNVNALIPSLRAMSDLFEGKNVLDIGCCEGRFSLEAADFGANLVRGIDILKIHIERAESIKSRYENELNRNYENVEYELCDFFDWSPKVKFDIALLLRVIGHTEAKYAMVKKLSELVDVVILNTPISHLDGLVTEYINDRDDHWIFLPTLELIEGLFEAHGYKCERSGALRIMTKGVK